MYENTKAPDATITKKDAKKGSAKNPVRSFCRSLLRGKPGVDRNEDEAAAVDAACQQMNRPRITKQGKFDWGSFSAFDDGSIEIERAGVKQWFRNFSEMKRSLNRMTKSEVAATRRA
jgi:hypothetical protein